MFRSLHDHHQAYLRIKLTDAGYMLGSQQVAQYFCNFKTLCDRLLFILWKY